MIEAEARLQDTDRKRERIRERYKGTDLNKLEIIPAIPEADFYDDSTIKRDEVPSCRNFNSK